MNTPATEQTPAPGARGTPRRTARAVASVAVTPACVQAATDDMGLHDVETHCCAATFIGNRASMEACSGQNALLATFPLSRPQVMS